jgi:hypothetical protein
MTLDIHLYCIHVLHIFGIQGVFNTDLFAEWDAGFNSPYSLIITKLYANYIHVFELSSLDIMYNVHAFTLYCVIC